jgi:hypothetical protein
MSFSYFISLILYLFHTFLDLLHSFLFFCLLLYHFIRHIIDFSFPPLCLYLPLFNSSVYLLFLEVFLFKKLASSSTSPSKKGDRVRKLLLLSETTGHFQELVSYSCMRHLVFTYRTFHKSIFVFMQPWNTTTWTIHTVSKSH